MKTPALILIFAMAASAFAQPGLSPAPKQPSPPPPAVVNKEPKPVDNEVPPERPEIPKGSTFALKLKAVGASMPMLKYELLPSFREQSKTNAALFYHRALHIYSEMRQKGKEANDAKIKIDELLAKPLADIPAEALRDYIKPYGAMYRELEAASKCRDCDWGIGERISAESYNLLLPELQRTRELAFLLKVRCRLHQKEGNLEAALKDIQLGITLGKHVGRSETMIAFLVGTAISTISIDELGRVLEMPKCPNLFWSLTALPRPFIPLDMAVEGELRSLDSILPLPKDIEEPMTTEQARLALDNVFARIQKFNSEIGSNGFPKLALQETRLGLAAYVTLMHPSARKALLESGKTEAEVNAMPAAQVVLLNSLNNYRNLRDEYMLWMTMPVEEALPGMKRSEDRLKEARNTPTDYFVTMLTMLLPATQQVYNAQLRTQRRIASLRVVEAIRLHAAKYGKPPTKLSEITIVTVPNDPWNGKPFDYVVNDLGFSVGVPAPMGQLPNAGNTWTYKVSWVK